MLSTARTSYHLLFYRYKEFSKQAKKMMTAERDSQSPMKNTTPPSTLTQRLKEAEAIESHLSQLEQARHELLLQQQHRLGAPPAPPPRPPVTPNVSTLSTDQDSPTTSSAALQRVMELAPQYFHDAASLQYIKEIIQQVDQQAVSPPTNALVAASKKRHLSKSRLGGEDGRYWEAVITSATIRHGRVEYEIRSQLTSSRTTGTSVVRRRYRDFDRLRSALVASAPDYVLIPKLPPKDTLKLARSRTDPDFVWNRRVGLQFWLRFVFEHQIIRNNSLLREFLWEPTSCAVSNEKKRFEDHNFQAEQKLWRQALQTQQRCMEQRFGNEVVALTSMQTRIHSQIRSLHEASRTCALVVKQDERMSRRLHQANIRFKDYAQWEISSGQNFTFLAKFSTCLPAKDVNRPVPEDSFLVSFKTNEHFVEAPVALGATCDVRSLKALSTLIHMWGHDIMPSLENHFVPPTQSSPTNVKAKRVACEWTEMETLRLGMIRDSLGRFVCDQIKHAQEERERWQGVVESIQDQQVELSSFFVALGDVVVAAPPPAPLQQQHSSDYFTATDTLNSSSSSARSSFSSDEEEEEALASPATAVVAPQVLLDSNLDEAQARFIKQQELAMAAAELLQQQQQQQQQQDDSFDGRNGFLNPFDDE